MAETLVDLVSVVDFARLAPSVHNTQPWRFTVEGDTLVVSRDPERQLTVMDPSGRQLVISCGAAVHLARLALREQGFDSDVEPFPAMAGPDVLAHVVARRGPRVTVEELVLADAARHRHMQRGAFEVREVPDDVATDIRAAAEEQGSWLRLVTRPDDLAAVAVLLSRAEEDELDDAAYRAELAAWTNRDPARRDGLPADATPDVQDRASNVRLRDFTGDAHASPGHPDVPPPAERPLVVVLGTEGDLAADWLRAGQAMMAMLLRATVEGVQAQPLGQVIDREWSRARLGAELGVLGHAQMVLRLGYGKPGADTPRRPVHEILDD